MGGNGEDGDGEDSTSSRHPGFAGLPEVHHESYGEPKFVRHKFTGTSKLEPGGESTAMSGTHGYEDSLLGPTSERGSYGQRSRTIGQEKDISGAFTSPGKEGANQGVVVNRVVLKRESKTLGNFDDMTKVKEKAYSFTRMGTV